VRVQCGDHDRDVVFPKRRPAPITTDARTRHFGTLMHGLLASTQRDFLKIVSKYPKFLPK
jgi:hypothetical protein